MNRIIIFLFLMCSFWTIGSYAQGLGGIGILDPSVLGGLVPQDVADATVKTAAFYTAHRPYSGATSMSNYNTLDIYIEATMMKVGDALPAALEANGFSTSTAESIPAVPIAKIGVRKGFGSSIDIGFSGLSYRGNSIYGGDIKVNLTDPEEGPSWGLRLGYTYLDVPVLYVKAHAFNPEIVVSRKLQFAEPYIGAGLRYAAGEVAIPYQPPLPVDPVTVKKYGSGMSEYLFTGVYFRILGPQGLRLGMEGSFDFGGFHTVGFVFGFGF